jgi:site-specific recombinase XerD
MSAADQLATDVGQYNSLSNRGEAPAGFEPQDRGGSSPIERAGPRGLLDHVKNLVVHSVASPHSRRAYSRAVEDFTGWWEAKPGRPPLSRALVQEYRSVLAESGMASSTINVRLAALRKLASEAADNGLLDPALAAGISRVRGAGRLGVRAGNWLTREQARELLAQPDASTLKGKRDRAMLALLLGCGLRRAELVNLTIDRIQQREARWVIVDLMGKGNRVRTVPVPAWVKEAIDLWIAAAGIRDGPVFRRISGAGVMGEGRLTEQPVWWVVKEYAAGIGVASLAPHDLRRTCAKLCRKAGGDLEQIQMLLGHASIQTTENYLGMEQNLVEAVNDRLGIVDAEEN